MSGLKKCYKKLLSTICNSSSWAVAVVYVIFCFFWIGRLGIDLANMLLHPKLSFFSLYGSGLTLLVLGYTTVFLGTLYFISFKEIINSKWYYFWPILLSLVFAISLLSVLYIESVPMLDYRNYDSSAKALLKLESFSQIKNGLYGVWRTRAFFFLYPIYFILGDNPINAELFNIIIHLLIGVNIFLLCRQWVKDEYIARVAAILYFLIPTQYLFLNTPNHDLIGLLLLLVVLNISAFFMRHYLLQKGINWKRETVFMLPLSFMLGIFCFLLNQIRISITFLVLCLALWFTGEFVLRMRNHYSKRLFFKYQLVILAVLAIPACSYFSLVKLFDNGRTLRSSNTLIWFLGAKLPADFYRSHRYDYYLIPKDKLLEYAVIQEINRWKFSPEVTSSRLMASWERASRLGDDYGKYIFEGASSEDDYSALSKLCGYILIIFRLAFLPLFILGAFKLMLHYKWQSPVFIGAIFSVVFLYTLTFGEVAHARYSILLYGFLTIFAAYGYDSWINNTKTNSLELYAPGKRKALLTIALVICLGIFSIYCLKVIASNTPKVFFSFVNPKAASLAHSDYSVLLPKARANKNKDGMRRGFYFSTVSKDKNDYYIFSWPLKDLKIGKSYLASGFIKVFPSESQITEIMINNKNILSSDKAHFASNSGMKIAFVNDAKFIAGKQNILQVKISKKADIGKLRMGFSIYGWYFEEVPEE